jgi:hypothetical protein
LQIFLFETFSLLQPDRQAQLGPKCVPKPSLGTRKKDKWHRPPACDHRLEAGATKDLVGSAHPTLIDGGREGFPHRKQKTENGKEADR